MNLSSAPSVVHRNKWLRGTGDFRENNRFLMTVGSGRSCCGCSHKFSQVEETDFDLGLEGSIDDRERICGRLERSGEHGKPANNFHEVRIIRFSLDLIQGLERLTMSIGLKRPSQQHIFPVKSRILYQTLFQKMVLTASKLCSD